MLIVNQVMDKHVLLVHLVFIPREADVIEVLIVVPSLIPMEVALHVNMALD